MPAAAPWGAAGAHLTAPEMTVLVGGLRVLNANTDQSPHGVFTAQPGALTNDFFVNLLDMSTVWSATSEDEAGSKAATGPPASVGGPVRGSIWCSAPTRNCGGLAEVYAESDSREKFVADTLLAMVRKALAERPDGVEITVRYRRDPATTPHSGI